jgi:HD-GYP domain-containing protein (c-di-GMP phosphodiesterase class II)
VSKQLRLSADSAGIVRSVAISAAAIALAIYAMTIQTTHLAFIVFSAVALLVAAGAVLQVSLAVRELSQRHEALHQASIQAEHHYFKVLRRIVAAVEAREPYTRGRSKRIAFLARRIAEKLGLATGQCHLIYLAAQVHDIGLLAVPDHILNKPSRLGSEEFRAVQRHAEASYRILQPLASLQDILQAVRYHHERMNGTGYPHQLAGETIPLTARILAVADAYDAMTHDRPHRPALPAIEALNELRRCSPAGYDSQCVEAIEEVMNMRRLQEVHQITAASPSA